MMEVKTRIRRNLRPTTRMERHRIQIKSIPALLTKMMTRLQRWMTMLQSNMNNMLVQIKVMKLHKSIHMKMMNP